MFKFNGILIFIFRDPIEQLERYGLEHNRAIRFLRRHKRRLFLKGRPRIFICQKCKKRFVSEKRYQTHLHIHKMKKRLQCRDCRKGFATFHDYKIHLKSSAHHFESKIIDTSTKNGLPIATKSDLLTKPQPIVALKLHEKEKSVVVDLTAENEKFASNTCNTNLRKFFPQLTVNSVKNFNSIKRFPNETFTLFDDVVCTVKNGIS